MSGHIAEQLSRENCSGMRSEMHTAGATPRILRRTHSAPTTTWWSAHGARESRNARRRDNA
eukprot:7031065-Lingulodinium_polyedra.AAC.1